MPGSSVVVPSATDMTWFAAPKDAIVPIERSLRLNPFDPQLGSTTALLALAHYQARNYEEALVQAKSAIQQNFAMANVILAAALARLDRIDEARRAVPSDLLTRAMRDTPRLASYANTSDRDHFLGGVALAGLTFGS